MSQTYGFILGGSWNYGYLGSYIGVRLFWENTRCRVPDVGRGRLRDGFPTLRAILIRAAMQEGKKDCSPLVSYYLFTGLGDYHAALHFRWLGLCILAYILQEHRAPNAHHKISNPFSPEPQKGPLTSGNPCVLYVYVALTWDPISRTPTIGPDGISPKPWV